MNTAIETHPQTPGVSRESENAIISDSNETSSDFHVSENNAFNLDDSIPVRIRFQIGQLDIPFGKISTLASGQVLPLEKPLSHELVTVYANDVLVAVGELVNVGQLVGIQITRLVIGEASKNSSFKEAVDHGPR